MKTKLALIKRAALLLLLSTINPQLSTWAQGTAFTYQGRLADGTNVANGSYDLRFYLRDALTVGNPVGTTNTIAPVAVGNGLFTVTLDFGGGIFTGPSRWLEIGLRTNGSAAAYTTLSPRQALTASPYAVLAGNAGNLGGQPATAFAPVSGSPAYVGKAGDTMTGSLNLAAPAGISFGFNTRQMLNLYDIAYGIGVQNYTLYQRTAPSGGFAWYAGGLHSNAQNDPGTNGTTLMTMDSYGDLTVTGAITGNGGLYGTSSGGSFGSGVSGYDSSGYNNATGVYGSSTTDDGVYGSGGNKGVYGITSSAGPTHAGVFGENSAVGGTAVVGNALAINSAGVAGVADTVGSTGVYGRGSLWAGVFQGNVNVTGAESFGSTTRQMLNLWSTNYGIGVQPATEYFRSGDTFCWFQGGSHVDLALNPGGGTTLMKLESFNPGVFGTSYGLLTVGALRINGGSDLAEPFQMSALEVPKGSVVVIDDENAGHLKLSDRTYDQRVAGVVSGANGVNPGIALHQDGTFEGGQNVALSGRVYVLADATGSSITPGDLLTTSGTPGHAMKATDHARAQGAILGKAMSSLKEGKGLVLVLVSLQ